MSKHSILLAGVAISLCLEVAGAFAPALSPPMLHNPRNSKIRPQVWQRRRRPSNVRMVPTARATSTEGESSHPNAGFTATPAFAGLFAARGGETALNMGSGYFLRTDKKPSLISDNSSEKISKTKDVLSGLVVALTSIPASTAFANIAGVNPLLGIWSSVILGLISALTGGRPGLIAGAAGVVAVPLAPLIATHGVAYMVPTVMLASLLAGMCSILKAGRLISLVTNSVMKGFLNGLGLLLLKSQIPVFASLQGAALSSAVGVASLTGAVTMLLPSITTAAPSSLIGVVLATILAQLFKLPIPTLADVSGAGTFAGGLSVLPSFGLPAVPASFSTLQIILPVAVSIAMISVLETLLAGKVVDEYKAEERKKNNAPEQRMSDEDDGKCNDRMLAGLSGGTMAAALFGGFGGCGLIPQTLLNMQSGGRGQLSSLSYAISMAACVVIAAPMIGTIPLASLAGVMITVALSTVQPAATIEHAKAALTRIKGGEKEGTKNVGAVTDLVSLVAASFVCYLVDMAAGIGLGVALTFIGRKFETDQ